MIRHVQRVPQRHARTRDNARIPTKRHRHLLAQLRIIQLRERTLAERE